MPIAPARSVAFEILLRVETESAFAAEIMHASGSKFQQLSIVDRALTTQLVFGVLRWQSRLDAACAGLTSLRKIDPEVLIALRLGALQLLSMERIPASAAVNDSVELVKRARKRSAAGLVNAVLRRVSDAPRITLPVTSLQSVQEIADQLAHPHWLVEGWETAYGLAAAEAICRHDQSVPAVALRIGDPQVAEELLSASIETEPGRLMRSARLVVAGDVLQTAAFARGSLAIQDEASQLVAALVGHGDRILDCCAAPGGKTRAIAGANAQAQVIAAEFYPHRARTMKKLGMPGNVTTIAADATALPLTGSFDRILVDVPCSGTGTLARNPEIKWRLKPSDLQELQRKQIAILKSALQWLAPGGRLIYSSCSLEHQENEQVVRAVLTDEPNTSILPVIRVLEEIRAELAWQDLNLLTRGELLRTIPGIHPGDGFFAAVLQRD